MKAVGSNAAEATGTSRNPRRVQKRDSVASLSLNIRSRSSDVIVLLSHCTPRCIYIMMSYYFIFGSASEFQIFTINEGYFT